MGFAEFIIGRAFARPVGPTHLTIELAETAPHPNPLPAKGGAREDCRFAQRNQALSPVGENK
jgi:hypothetical protein